MVTDSTQNHTVQDAKQHSYQPDWILYTVPGSAFLLGLGLFLLVLKTQARRRAEVKEVGCVRGKQARQSLNGITSDSLDTAVALQKAKSVDTLSYENIGTGIYQSHDAVTRCSVDSQEDYILPVENHDGMQWNFNTHHAAQHLNQYESYENMVSALYTQSIKRTEQPVEADNEDYIDPGQMAASSYYMQHSESLHDIDAESYVDMDPQHKLHPDFHHEEEEDSYEKMASVDLTDEAEGV